MKQDVFGRKEISSFSYIETGYRGIDVEPPELGPFYSVFLYDTNWTKHDLFKDVSSKRDAQWLVCALSREFGLLPPLFGREIENSVSRKS